MPMFSINNFLNIPNLKKSMQFSIKINTKIEKATIKIQGCQFFSYVKQLSKFPINFRRLLLVILKFQHNLDQCRCTRRNQKYFYILERFLTCTLIIFINIYHVRVQKEYISNVYIVHRLYLVSVSSVCFVCFFFFFFTNESCVR